MSKFEDYNAVSGNYDNHRYAMGTDVICGMVQFYTKKALQDLHVLDAGCGTGNYALDMIGHGIGQFTLLDASEGMLEKARKKLAKFVDSERVREIVQATLPSLPFPDASFDVVMFNMVLHHLERSPDGNDFPTIEATLKEARRVLKPGGVLSISTGYPLDSIHLYWFMQLNKTIGERHAKQYPTSNHWENMFKKSGFQTLTELKLTIRATAEALAVMRDPEAPMKKQYRDGFSYWASATPDEIADVENKIQRMKEEGTLEGFVNDNDKSGGKFEGCLLFAKSIE